MSDDVTATSSRRDRCGQATVYDATPAPPRVECSAFVRALVFSGFRPLVKISQIKLARSNEPRYRSACCYTKAGTRRVGHPRHDIKPVKRNAPFT